MKSYKPTDPWFVSGWMSQETAIEMGLWPPDSLPGRELIYLKGPTELDDYSLHRALWFIDLAADYIRLSK